MLTRSARLAPTRALRTRLPTEIQKLWPPRESRFVLSEMRVFSGCHRRQLARVARWGDIIEVAAGEVLVREDHTDYWFFVILQGAARVTHRSRDVARLHRGDHFGELAIIGFRPQPATVTATESSVLFVLSRQHLLSLAALDTSVQRALFPEIDPAAFPKFRRELQEEGRRSWDRLVPKQRAIEDGLTAPPKIRRRVRTPMLRPPGRSLSWDEAIDQLSHRDRKAPTIVPIQISAPPRWARLIPVAVVAVVAVLTALVFHPPLAVITSGEPIDVVRDISVHGASVEQPTGRYLMTTVDVDRPNLAGLLVAWIVRRTVVPAESESSDVDFETERRAGREAFLRSHRLAVELAEKELGVDATGVSIAIRERQIAGPSAGLVYALAILDLLDSGDLADGRTISATGELLPGAKVGRVAFVRLKANAARRGGASLFLVPKSQGDEAAVAGLSVVEVDDLKAAVRAIESYRAAR